MRQNAFAFAAAVPPRTLLGGSSPSSPDLSAEFEG